MPATLPPLLALLLLASAAVAQTDWAWRFPRPQGHGLFGVAWTGTRFVAVGEHGTCALSADGEAWTASWTGVRKRLSAVAWAESAREPGAGTPGTLVAVGDSGTILTSPDAGTWTPRASGTPHELFGVAHGSGAYVAVGDHGVILSSPDARTWTRRESGVDHPLLAVAWAGTRFVALSGGLILTSPDGLAWTPRPLDAHAPLRGAGYGAGRIVVVGDDATILTSDDGVAWTLRHQAIVQLRGVVWTGDRFLAAGKYGYVRSSRDGITWDSAYVGNDADYFAVAHAPSPGPAGRAVIVGNAGSIAATDAAGRWSVRSVGVQKTMRAVAGDGRGRHVAVGDDGTILRGDGADFAPESLGTVNGFRSVVWTGPRDGSAGDGRWVAAGWLGVARSPDGRRWEKLGEERYDPRLDIRSLAWMDAPGAAGAAAEPLLVAACAGGALRTSPDGGAWTLRDSGRADLNSVAWSGERLVAVGAGPILASADARAWSVAHPGPGAVLNHVAAGAGGFLAVGAGGAVLTSPDGLLWTPRESGTDRELHGATWTGRQWIVTGEGGLVLRSPDGVAWGPASQMSGSTLYAVLRTGTALGPEGHTLLAVGADATVLSAREDPAVGARPAPARPPRLDLQPFPGGLRVRLPDGLRGVPVRLSVYGASGGLRLRVRGRYPREAVLPLYGIPTGAYVLEIRSRDRHASGAFRLAL